jgi:hypothetical protein
LSVDTHGACRRHPTLLLRLQIPLEVAALGLIKEYQAMVYPVLVGGGIPFFPQRERRVDLELVETRTFSSRVVYLHYRVAALALASEGSDLDPGHDPLKLPGGWRFFFK